LYAPGSLAIIPRVRRVDVIVVAYRSGRHLRACVEPLCGQPDINVIVVDNACPEHSPATLEGLPVTLVVMGRNAGFGAGCNAGAARSSSDTILYLNPDARIAPVGVRQLAARLHEDAGLGIVGPRLVEPSGETQLTMRREPTVGTAFGEALFLHRAFPNASWPTEIVRRGYDTTHEVEWLGGAALCVRRSAFVEVGGFDERFFMYSEDVDLGKRLRVAGYTLLYDPAVIVQHEGGASTPDSRNPALRAKARITYAYLHEPSADYIAFRVAIALNELVRLPVAAVQSTANLRDRLRALRIALTWHPHAWLNGRGSPDVGTVEG
jgi:N-acetylglucosaminyl-diphospho-decaprenol L-rhamnosyltransferase